MSESKTIAGYTVYDPINHVFKIKGLQDWTSDTSNCGLYTKKDAEVIAMLCKTGFAVVVPVYMHVGDIKKEGVPYCRRGKESLMSAWIFEQELLESD